ncbi:hypothetical protein [Streptomyces sp. NPDC047315]|uniref:hypothetical protein n=1 Tax=Streptomyces sp. NPDC047315 TaxID=3155142 RepID=UPI0033E1CBF6
MTGTRHTADTITDDALDQLYTDRDFFLRLAQDARVAEERRTTERDEQQTRAVRAQAALARVRTALARLCDDVPHPGHDHLCPDDIQRAIENALDEQQEHQP